MKNIDTTLTRQKITYAFKEEQDMILIVYIKLFALGCILLGVAFYHYKQTMFLLRYGINTTAVVTDLIKIEDNDGDTYRPVFTFTDHNGNRVSVQSDISSSSPPWKINDQVSMVYKTSTPSIAKVVSFWGLFRWAVICLMAAAPLLIVSVCYFSFLGFTNVFEMLQLSM